VRISGIESGSIAEELELRVGTRIIRINGERVRDGIDLTFMLAEPELEIEAVDPDGHRAVLEVDRDPGEPMGIVPAPDKIRECANECVFCFIDGNPPGVRDALWVRDDDFRLSFTYGSYVTLTNLGTKGLHRLVDQRLSPLYVSVHATDPQVRIRLLKNERAGLIMDHLRFLTDRGIEVHAQVVLCPGWNDGFHLDRTIRDLYGLEGGIRTLSVVPVGLTRYNLHRPVRLLTESEAGDAVDRIERARIGALEDRGYGWCYAADELFLAGGRELPPSAYYDDQALTENGVGAVRQFLDALDAGLTGLPDFSGSRIRILTGASMTPIIEAHVGALAGATGAEVEVHGVRNEFFGESVTVAGLLAGRDLLAAAAGAAEGDVILIPEEALNHDRLFVDSYPLERLRAELAPARVVPGLEITAALRSL
jgi:putative radical SAM enzyme (TIGR03279 family)